jgi:hypothetical protein
MQKKTFRNLLALALVMAFVLVGALGALAYNGAMTAHATGTTSAYVILPADSNAHTVVQALNVTSDKAASKLVAYWADATTTTVASASTGTTLAVASSTGFAGNNLIAVQTAGGSVSYRTVSSVATGELTLGSALTANAGDTVYLLAVAAANTDAEIPVGAATKELTNQAGVLIGPKGSPLLLMLDGTSACAINYLTWGLK